MSRLTHHTLHTHLLLFYPLEKESFSLPPHSPFRFAIIPHVWLLFASYFYNKRLNSYFLSMKCRLVFFRMKPYLCSSSSASLLVAAAAAAHPLHSVTCVPWCWVESFSGRLFFVHFFVDLFVHRHRKPSYLQNMVVFLCGTSDSRILCWQKFLPVSLAADHHHV